MKAISNILRGAVVVASVAMIAGCAKGYEETAKEPVKTPTTKKITFSAAQSDFAGDTRTTLNNDLSVSWLSTDTLGMYIAAYNTDENFFPSENIPFSIKSLNTETDVATFENDENITEMTGEPLGVIYAAYLPYSKDAATGQPGKVQLSLPTIQHPTLTSFDPAADILFATALTTGQDIGVGQDGGELMLDFKRPFAIGQFEFTNIASDVITTPEDEEVKSVTFTFDEGLDVVGGFTMEIDTDTFVPVSMTNSVTLDYTDSGVMLDNLVARWVMNPVTITTMKVEILTTRYSITKTFDLSAKNITFKPNTITKSDEVRMTGATIAETNLLAKDSEGNGIYIPDANFLDYCKNSMGTGGTGWDKDSDGKLSSTEAAAVKSMSVASEGIASLSGIEYFTGLQLLDCQSNSLTTLDLSANTALEELEAYQNQLTSIVWPTNSDNLNLISLAENKLTSIDVSRFPALEGLLVDDNEIASIDVTNNPNLQALTFMGNSVSSIDLSKNSELLVLTIDYNKLTSLDISNNPKLGMMTCTVNPGNGEKFRVKLPKSFTVPVAFTAAGSYWGYLINEDDEDETTIYIEYYE
jgi:hypothetical protein